MKVHFLVCWNYGTILKKFGAHSLARKVDNFMKVCLDELQPFLSPKGDGLDTKCELYTICTKLNE
jgi:hypothetical protein